MQELRVGKEMDWLPDEPYYKLLMAKAILYKTVARIVRQEQFSAYRPNIVAYLIAYLSSRTGGRLDMDLVWQEQELSGELEELLRSWSHEIDDTIRKTAEGRNVTEWCKKEDCWNNIRGLDLPMSDPLPPELEGHTEPGRRRGRRAAPITPQDYENLAECKKLDGEKWLKIHAWGVRTGLLQNWQCGIAQTLSGYAANGWNREPSHKQARQGVKILEIARQHESEIDAG